MDAAVVAAASNILKEVCFQSSTFASVLPLLLSSFPLPPPVPPPVPPPKFCTLGPGWRSMMRPSLLDVEQRSEGL